LSSTNGEQTVPKVGTAVLNSFTQSNRHTSFPSAAFRQTSTSRMPATYNRLPSNAGVARIQLPFLAAKNGTVVEPSHFTCHACLPVLRS
jgi:hypothetical protein